MAEEKRKKKKRIGNGGSFHIHGAAGAPRRVGQDAGITAATFVFTKLLLPVSQSGVTSYLALHEFTADCKSRCNKKKTDVCPTDSCFQGGTGSDSRLHPIQALKTVKGKIRTKARLRVRNTRVKGNRSLVVFLFRRKPDRQNLCKPQKVAGCSFRVISLAFQVKRVTQPPWCVQAQRLHAYTCMPPIVRWNPLSADHIVAFPVLQS